MTFLFNRDPNSYPKHSGPINPTKRAKRTQRQRICQPDQIFRDRLIPRLERLGYNRFKPNGHLATLFGQPTEGTFTEEYLMVRCKTNGKMVEMTVEDGELEARWPGGCERNSLDDSFDSWISSLMNKINRE